MDWSALFRCASLDEALGEVARGLGWSDAGEIVIESGLDARREKGHWAGAPGGAASRRASLSVPIPGKPPWVLRIASPKGAPDERAAAAVAASAVAAWRSARAEIGRPESILAARTRELSLVQSVGRAAAEARTPAALFVSTADLLHQGLGAEAVAVVHALQGGVDGEVYAARPLSGAAAVELARIAADAAGIDMPMPEAIRVLRLAGFDGGAAERGTMREPDTAATPLLRRGRPVAGIAMAPQEPPGERELRVFFGVANQLALHLDRVLAMAESEQGRFRSILDSMPQAVILTDPELRVLQANLSAERLLERIGGGRRPARLRGIGSLDLEPLAAAAARGEPLSPGQESMLAGGTVLEVTVSAVADEGGAHEGLVIVLSDETERRRLQAHLAQSEKLSSLGEMISGIAHELNNPLASVLGYSQLLRTVPTLDAKTSARIETVHREAQRCQKIVQNLLSFARRHDPERRRFSLNEVVDSVLGLVAYSFRVANVRVRRELDSDLPAIVGDDHLVQQAILNLVTNAQQALGETSRGGVVTIRTSRAGFDRVVLEVSDDGPGIPAAILPRIFDPFFTTKAVGQGTGLGLSLVYGTVTSHGGTIRVDSREGEGASFRIELPVGEDRLLPSSRDARPRGASRRTARGRILVVDDEDAVAGLICETLSADGHEVRPARDGQEALRRLAEEEFDLVVADLRMPGIGGVRLYEEMERLQPGVSRKILLTTGDTLSRESETLAERSGLTMLLKPFDLDDLRRAVRSRLGKERGH